MTSETKWIIAPASERAEEIRKTIPIFHGVHRGWDKDDSEMWDTILFRKRYSDGDVLRSNGYISHHLTDDEHFNLYAYIEEMAVCAMMRMDLIKYVEAQT